MESSINIKGYTWKLIDECYYESRGSVARDEEGDECATPQHEASAEALQTLLFKDKIKTEIIYQEKGYLNLFIGV